MFVENLDKSTMVRHPHLYLQTWVVDGPPTGMVFLFIPKFTAASCCIQGGPRSSKTPIADVHNAWKIGRGKAPLEIFQLHGVPPLRGWVWDDYGMIMGVLWDDYGMIMVLIWDGYMGLYGMIMGLLWDDYGIMMGSLWDYYGIIMG